ncbi:MAG: DNA internalization-related competence protein ComEC/Rec2 [Fibrobacteres bacterium]|nr:DNA internalization-related competence protein ComEC/Rec2 [Fibrobacterota bacterium]
MNRFPPPKVQAPATFLELLQPLRGVWFCLGVFSGWAWLAMAAPFGAVAMGVGLGLGLVLARRGASRLALGFGLLCQGAIGSLWSPVLVREESNVPVTAVVERVYPSGAGIGRVLECGDSAWIGSRVRLRGGRVGDTLRGPAIVRPPREATVPGTFDERGWMASEGLDGRVSWGDSLVVGSPEHPRGASVSDKIRQHVREVLAVRLEPSSAALWTATILAENDRVPAAALDAFRQSGLFHMLSVSGFHMAVLGGGTLLLLCLVRVPRRIAWIAAALVVVAYAALLGASAPIARSALAFALASLAWVSGRPVHSGNAFFLALGALVAMDPHVPFQLGAQLTFAATAALLWISPVLERMTIPVRLRGGRWEGWLLQPMLLSVSATLATAPILAWSAGTVPWIGIPAGLAGGVVFSVGFLAALGTVALSFLPPWAASGFSGAADGAARLVWELTLRSGQWPGGTFYPGKPDVATLLLLLATLVGLALLGRPALRWKIVPALLTAWGCWAWPGMVRTPRAMEVAFLDVGQGNATLVTWPSGRVWLIDAGPASWKDRARNAGTEKIVPYLRRKGVEHLDAVVVSHADLDHWGGLPGVAAKIGPSRLMLSLDSGTPGSPGFDSVVAELQSGGWRVERLGQGQKLTYGDGARCEVLGPGSTGPMPRNRTSLVLRFVFDSSSVLVTGDADSVEEAEILRSQLNVTSDLLQAGHHGSRHSTSLEWLREVAPRRSVLAYGAKNRYGHPNAQVLERMDSAGVEPIHLPLGSAFFRMDGHGVEEIDLETTDLWRGPWRRRYLWAANGS